ncbi:MAG TPA: amino acid adenylation domain-containing protein [Gemmatimonadales bacterium]|nr:amino acid adenylation domain-containing protein [Gemmatimonadales bacterium]
MVTEPPRPSRPRSVVPQRPDPRTAPLSFIQWQMWLMDQFAPGNAAYNFPWGLRLRGRLNFAALEASFNAAIRRHEILRTTFAVEGGEPRQVVHPDLAIRIAVTPLEHIPQDEREAMVQRLATAESVLPFDVRRLPLIRAAVFTLGPTEQVLMVNLHHALADGLSVTRMLQEVDAGYRAIAAGGDPDLSPPALQYGDFAQWQRSQWADDAGHASAIDYWRRALGENLPVLELPGDRPRSTVRSFRGSNVYHRIPSDIVDGVRKLAARERGTEFTAWLAAYQVLLARYTEASDLVIGTPLGTREREELEPLLGNFLTMVGLRCDLSGNPSFVDLLRRSRDATFGALENAVPLPVVMRHLAIERVAGRNPLFQVLLDLQRHTALKIGDMEVEPFFFDLGVAQFDLGVHILHLDDGYVARFEYSTDVFDRETVEGMAAAFTEVARHAIAHPELPALDLPMLGDNDRQGILGMSQGPATDVADVPVHALVEAQTARTPDRVAVRAGKVALTYADLDARASGVAGALRARGAERGQRIGVCLERSDDLLVTLLGILKTGAAYVPLDPAYPAPRLRFMAEDAQLSLLVSTGAVAGWCSLPRERQVLLDVDGAELVPGGASDRPGAADPAYVIYTSGSTGTPKGVVVGHGAVVNLLTGMAEAPGLEADDVLLAVTTMSFDIAVLELFLPLCVGATVVVATREEARDGRALGSLLERHQVTAMQATPVTWRLLLEAGWQGGGRTFKALVGGEALPGDLARALLERGVELWNMYGPTETTVWSTCAHIEDPAADITVGRPIANTIVRVLDSRRRLCPVGVPGELWIGGAGLALGYWNRPELTEERFIAGPEGAPGTKLYRTGDRVRLRRDGMLEHLGRLDDQVKLRGFRIELGGIEANLARQPGVREAAAAVRPDEGGDPHLVAYLVVESGSEGMIEDLRTRLRAELPEFMIPSQYVVLETLPRTANGKLDYRALPAPAVELRTGAPAVAPRTDAEVMVLEIFRDVLRRPDAGVDDNFFDLGGDSLMAARLVLRLRDASGCDVPLGLLFERQTTAGLAEAVERLILAAPPMPREMSAIDTGERVEIEL